jgi:outer membrane protein OmpA-like peptidoglycan-associated protein
MSKHFTKSKKMTFIELHKKIGEFIVDNEMEDNVDVHLTSKGIEMSFKDKLLFDLGKADLRSRAYSILGKIAGLLNYEEITDRKIIVEGHTDSVPIKSDIYPSNWELSSARASKVVNYFITQEVKGKRFESIGFADTRPLVKETGYIRGQPKNRRVVVVISPEAYIEDYQRKELDIVNIEQYLKDRNSKGFSAQNKFNKSNNITKTTDLKKKTSNNQKETMRKYFTLGQQAYKNGKYEKAITYWQKVLRIDPHHKLSKDNITRANQKLVNK